MDVEQFIAAVGGRAEVIRETGLTKGRISQWVKARSIPRHWVKFFRVKYPDLCEQHGIVEAGEPA
jgi:hypothetical protein